MNPTISSHSLYHSNWDKPDIAPKAIEDSAPVIPASPPSLTPPSELRFSDLRLLATTEETRGLGNAILDTLGLRLSCIKENISTLAAENMKKLKENAERASSSEFWGMLKRIATTLLSTLSVVFGVSLLSTGGGLAFVGGAMIASGILSLANFAFSEMGTWDWLAKQLAHDNEEHQKKIAMILPIAVGVVSAGLGLAGSAWSVGTGAVQFAEKIMYVAQTALTIFNVGTSFAKGYADTRLIWKQAELSTCQAELTAERAEYSSLMQEIKSSLNDFRNVKSQARQAIQNISQSNIQLVR